MPVSTPNMNLQQPIIGTDSGLTWEQSTNANADVIDAHNHTAGSGVPIPPSGLNINSALPFNNQKATSVGAVEFQDQVTLSDTNAAYTKSGDLFFNDGAGNTVQITSGGAVNATSSGISSGTATASFVSSTLVVNADTSKPADIKGGSVFFGNNTTGSHYAKLQPPNAMASDFTLTLPSVPASQSFMTVDTSGNMAGYASINQGITRSNLAAVGQQVSSSSGSFFTTSTSYVDVTNLSVTITTTGRPVMVFMAPVAAAISFFESSTSTTTTDAISWIKAFRDVANIGETFVHGGPISSNASILAIPVSSFMWFDVPAAGTYTYKIQVKSQSSAVTTSVFQAQLVAYEL